MQPRKISLKSDDSLSHNQFVVILSQLWQALMTVKLAVLVHHAIDPFLDPKDHVDLAQSDSDCFVRSKQAIKLLRTQDKSVPPALARKALQEHALREYCVTIIFIRLFGPSTTNLINKECGKVFCIFNNEPKCMIDSSHTFMEFLHNYAHDINMDTFRAMVHQYWNDVHRSVQSITNRVIEFHAKMKQLNDAIQVIPFPTWNCSTSYQTYDERLRANSKAQQTSNEGVNENNKSSASISSVQTSKQVPDTSSSLQNDNLQSSHASESKQQESLAHSASVQTQSDSKQIDSHANLQSVQTVNSNVNCDKNNARSDDAIDSLTQCMNNLQISNINGNSFDNKIDRNQFYTQLDNVNHTTNCGNDTTVVTTLKLENTTVGNNVDKKHSSRTKGASMNVMAVYTPSIDIISRMIMIPFDVHSVQTFTISHIVDYALNKLVVASVEIQQQIDTLPRQSNLFTQYITLSNRLTDNAIQVAYALLQFASTEPQRQTFLRHIKWLFNELPVTYEYANKFIKCNYHINEFFPFSNTDVIQPLHLSFLRPIVNKINNQNVYAVAVDNNNSQNSVHTPVHSRAHHVKQPYVVRIPSILSQDNSAKRTYVSQEQKGSDDIMDSALTPQQLQFNNDNNLHVAQTSNVNENVIQSQNQLNDSNITNLSSSLSEQQHANLINVNNNFQDIIDDSNELNEAQIDEVFHHHINYLTNLKQHLIDNSRNGKRAIPSAGCKSTAYNSPHKLKSAYIYDVQRDIDDDVEAQLPHIAMQNNNNDNEIHNDLNVDDEKEQAYNRNNGAFVPHSHYSYENVHGNTNSGVNRKQRDIYNRSHGYSSHSNDNNNHHGASSYTGNYSEGPTHQPTSQGDDTSSIAHFSTHSLHNFPSHTSRKTPYQPPRMPAPGNRGNGGNNNNNNNNGHNGNNNNYQHYDPAEFARREAEKARINAQVREETKDAIQNIKRNFHSTFHGFPNSPSNIDTTIQHVAKQAIAFIVAILLWYSQYVKPNKDIFTSKMAVSHIVSQLKSQAARQFQNDRTHSQTVIATVPEFIVYFMKAYVKSEHLPELKREVMADMPSAIEVKHNLSRAFEAYKTVIGIYNEIIDLAWNENYITSNAEYNDLVASDDDVYLHIFDFLQKQGITDQFLLKLTDQLDPIKVPMTLENLNIAMDLYQKCIDKSANMTARIKAKRIVTKQRSSCTDPTATVAGKSAQAHYFNNNRYGNRNNRGRGRGRKRGRNRGGRNNRQQYNNNNYTNDPKYNPMKNRPNKGRGRGNNNNRNYNNNNYNNNNNNNNSNYNNNNYNNNNQSSRGGYRQKYNKHNNNNRTSYNRGRNNNNRGKRGRGKGRGKKQFYKAVPLKGSQNKVNGTSYNDATNNPNVNVSNLPNKKGNAYQTHKSQNGHNNNNNRANNNNKNYSAQPKNHVQYCNGNIEIANSDFGSDLSSIHTVEYESPPPVAYMLNPSQH